MPQLRYSAWAHHPYTKDLPPTRRDRNRDSITMANIGELSGLLDALGARTGRVPAVNHTLLGEFGFETDPPDPYNGIGLQEHADYLNIGDFLAYRDPRVLANTQFLLRDVPPIMGAKGKRRWFTYQSGLYFANGRPKPAAGSYLMPFHVTARNVDSVDSTVNTFWGQVRFFPNRQYTTVHLQYRIRGSQIWETVGDPINVSNEMNFWEAAAAVRGSGSWRAVWIDPFTGLPTYSREIDLG
jgi:hypothetical protein